MQELFEKISEKIKKDPTTYTPYEDMYQVSREVIKEDIPTGVKWLEYLSSKCEIIIPNIVHSDLSLGQRLMNLHKRSLLVAAPFSFPSYLEYVEWTRAPEKKFWIPRKQVLKPLALDLQDLSEGKLDFLGISLPPRVGKLVSDDTPVMTREGWKNHGALVVGDEVVGLDGTYKKVLHVFEKNVADYEVEFSNGEKIKCHGKHEWVVHNRHRHKMETLETEEILAQRVESGIPNTRGHRYHFQLPQCTPMLGEEIELPVEPYVLGAWLGDGTNTKPLVTICDTDIEILFEMMKTRRYSMSQKNRQVGCVGYHLIGLREELRSIGLCHRRNRIEKFIPEIYLQASIRQRLRLLAGLIDTDGTLTNGNKYQYSAVSEKLLNGVCDLISTFGWRYCMTKSEPNVSSSGIEGKYPVYTISFCPDIVIPCKVRRKRLKAFALRRKVSIKSITPIEPVSGNCIQVEGGVYRVGKTMIPTHNSTLCIFFMTWIMGKRPNVASVMSGHSDKLTDGFYRELLSIITDPSQYGWADVFPNVPIVDNSAKNETIDLGKKKRFPTITCRSVGGTLTGAVEIGSGGILYVDDLIEDLEESLNPLRLQAKYDAYLNQLKDRKKMGALELMVGTRWNVFDPLGRIQEQYAENPRYRFRVIPALDENSESNFCYAYNLGFSTAYYQDMKDSIDDATWNAKYMGTPYIREGLLFPEDSLRTYNGVLPDGEPEKIAVCDVAWGGGDSLAMPIAYIYGNDVYIHDVIFNRGDKTVTYPVVIGRIKQHFPHKARFESNNGGSEYADYVDEQLRNDGIHINVFSKPAPTKQSKLARIIQFSPDIKSFYFLGEKYRSKEYRTFMRELTLFVQTGKNAHDDAPDSLSMLADELYSKRLSRVEVIARPW